MLYACPRIFFLQVSTNEGWNPLNFYLLGDAQCDEETVRNIELGHTVPIFQVLGQRSK